MGGSPCKKTERSPPYGAVADPGPTLSTPPQPRPSKVAGAVGPGSTSGGGGGGDVCVCVCVFNIYLNNFYLLLALNILTPLFTYI